MQSSWWLFSLMELSLNVSLGKIYKSWMQMKNKYIPGSRNFDELFKSPILRAFSTLLNNPNDVLVHSSLTNTLISFIQWITWLPKLQMWLWATNKKIRMLRKKVVIQMNLYQVQRDVALFKQMHVLKQWNQYPVLTIP